MPFMKAITITTVTHRIDDSEIKGKVPKKSGKRIGYNYIILRSLKKSRKNDVVTCLYIKSLTQFGFCVIKEGSYGDSKDKQGRDIIDRLIWQKQLHSYLQGKIRVPRLLGSFEENGNYYLVLERIRGKTLFKAIDEKGHELRAGLISGSRLGLKFMGYLIQIIDLLDTLHIHQVVHRDVTATNFIIMRGGEVAIIDMELSYSLLEHSPSPPFQLGTHGYMSPEQLETRTPTTNEDVFSFGAIMLLLWTGISPRKLTDEHPHALARKINFLVPDFEIANIILKCLDPEPNKRPKLDDVRKVISTYKENVQRKISRVATKTTSYTQIEVKDLIQQSINTISSSLMADEKGWFSDTMNRNENHSSNKIYKVYNASYNRGVGGIMYLLAKAKSLGYDVDACRPNLEIGLQLIEERYIRDIVGAPSGLHFGAAGVAACLGTAIEKGLITPNVEYIDWLHLLLDKQNHNLSIMHGLAGQGFAHWLCMPFLHNANVKVKLEGYTNVMLEKQEKDGSWIRSMNGKKKRITKGFANGVAGLVYFLAEYSRQYKSESVLGAAQKGLHWLTKKACARGEAVEWLSSSGSTVPPWWCEGAPGIALSFLKMYSLTNEIQYKILARRALLINSK
jgi:serine/threonine protein kinase